NRDLLGPWSDCYAIGASIFACLANAAPQAADGRAERDRYVSAAKMWDGKYSRQLLETIEWCLELDHMRRPQSVFALQKVLLREKDPEVHRKSSFLENLRSAWKSGPDDEILDLSGKPQGRPRGERGSHQLRLH